MAKDFSKISTSRAATNAEKATAKAHRQSTASIEEQESRAAELKTQGRKGCKLDRINLACTPENYDFCKTMSAIYGMNMTQYVNKLIAEYRAEHGEVYAAAKALREKV